MSTTNPQDSTISLHDRLIDLVRDQAVSSQNKMNELSALITANQLKTQYVELVLNNHTIQIEQLKLALQSTDTKVNTNNLSMNELEKKLIKLETKAAIYGAMAAFGVSIFMVFFSAWVGKIVK